MSKRRQNYMKQCDAVFSKIIRARGYCEAGPAKCQGLHQNAHGFPRTYRATMCDERNAFCLCQHHHVYYTYRPIEWDKWLRERWGEDLYQEIRMKALSYARVDWRALLPELKARLEEVA